MAVSIVWIVDAVLTELRVHCSALGVFFFAAIINRANNYHGGAVSILGTVLECLAEEIVIAVFVWPCQNRAAGVNQPRASTRVIKHEDKSPVASYWGPQSAIDSARLPRFPG